MSSEQQHCKLGISISYQTYFEVFLTKSIDQGVGNKTTIPTHRKKGNTNSSARH